MASCVRCEKSLLVQSTPKSAPKDGGWWLGRPSWPEDYTGMLPPSARRPPTEEHPRYSGPPTCCRRICEGLSPAVAALQHLQDMSAKTFCQFQMETSVCETRADGLLMDDGCSQRYTRPPHRLMVWRGHLEVLLAFSANGIIPVPRCRS